VKSRGEEKDLKNEHVRRIRLLALMMAATLAACGGGGGGGTTDGVSPAAKAADDAVTVPWNTTTSVSVTENDHVSGTVSIDVGVPGHGTARVEGGKLMYTPAQGYFGPDSFSYTVASSAGGRSASDTATVHVEVTATLQIEGTVADAPMPNAQIDVAVGGEHQVATTDAQGHYQLTLSTHDPSAFVTIDVTGSGTQSFVKLRSFVGSFASLAQRSSQSVVDSAKYPRLDVTHISTALAVLAAQANGGAAPASEEEFAASTARIDPAAWLDMATSIKMIADGHLVLPAGYADTLALVGAPSAYQAFLRSIGSASDVFSTVRNAVAEGMSAGAPAALNPGQSHTLVAYEMSWSPNVAYLIESSAGGEIKVTGNAGQVAAVVSRAEESITLSFSTSAPVYIDEVSADEVVDPSTGQSVWANFNLVTTALKLQQAAGVDNVIVVTPTRMRVWTSGPLAGQASPDPSPALSIPMHLADLAARLPIASSEFSSGMRWAGFLPASTISGAAADQDLFVMSTGMGATALNDAITYTFSVTDNLLTIDGAGTRRDYARLVDGTAAGSEAWLVIDRTPNGLPTSVAYIAVVSSPTPFSWSLGEAAHTWQLYASADSNWLYRLHGDSGLTGERQTWALGGPSGITQSLTWQFGGDQSITMNSPRSLGYELRVWLPVKRSGSSVCMLQSVSLYEAASGDASLAYRRVGCVADLGTTSP
jgi:hypothetical protein